MKYIFLLSHYQISFTRWQYAATAAMKEQVITVQRAGMITW
jgi:hypothetical protein